MALDLLRKMAMRLTQRAEARLNRTPGGVSSCRDALGPSKRLAGSPWHGVRCGLCQGGGRLDIHRGIAILADQSARCRKTTDG